MSVSVVFCLCIQKARAMCEKLGFLIQTTYSRTVPVPLQKSVPYQRTVPYHHKKSVPYLFAKIEAYRTAILLRKFICLSKFLVSKKLVTKWNQKILSMVFEIWAFYSASSTNQRWSPRGRPWPRGHILKSLASRPQVLENWPVLGSRTALFF